MKKFRMVILSMVILSMVLCLCLLCGYRLAQSHALGENTVPPPSHIHVGMAIDDIDELYTCPGLLNYFFIEDTDGNPVIVTSRVENRKYSVASVTAYDKNTIDFSEVGFRKIDKGMTVHEVVSLVGNPLGCFSCYLDELTWSCDGIMYSIKLEQHPDDSDVLIVRDVLQEDVETRTMKSIID